MAEKGIKTTRGAILRTAHKNGVASLQELAIANIRDLAKVIEYNESQNIRFFRITSNLFPHMENPRLLLRGYDIEFARDELEKVGRLARGFGHRLTMHPGQYVQLGSPTAKVAEQSIRDLTLHAKILLAMGMTTRLGSVCVIHGGGKYDDPPSALRRWAERYHSMPEEIRQFIVLENDEHWSIAELLPFCEEHRIPLVVDFFHHTLRGEGSAVDLMPRVLRIWRTRGIPPKCHISAQALGKRRGAHADCIDIIPPDIYWLCHKEQIDVCLEVKNKDICLAEVVAKLIRKYKYEP